MLLSCFPLALAYFYDARDVTAGSGTTRRAEAQTTVMAETGLALVDALRTSSFWLIAISFIFGGGAIVSVMVHLIPLLTDRGLSAISAAGAASSMSIAAVVGRISAGYSLDRIFAPRIAAVFFAFPIVGCVGLIAMPVNPVWPYVSAVLFGFALGAEYNLISYLSARYFGFKAYAVIYGLLFAAFCAGQAILPPIIGIMYEFEGNYQNALEVLAGSFFVSAGILQFLRAYPDWGGEDTNSAGTTLRATPAREPTAAADSRFPAANGQMSGKRRMQGS
jgi:hypothetical protein